MALRAIFQWLNNDSTADLNRRFSSVFQKGITEGGLIVPVSGELQVNIQPYVAMTANGLLIEETSPYLFEDLSPDQVTVLTVYGKWQSGEDTVTEYRKYEISEWNSVLDPEDHVVIGTVTLGSVTQVLESDISYDLRDVFDKLGRSSFRGNLSDSAGLPTDGNREQDFYIVGGAGGLVEIYAWNGTTWLNITNTLALQAALDNHRNNAFVNEKHLTDDQKDAVLGTSGVPNASNRFVTSTDPRMLTLTQVDAVAGSHGAPSSTNRFVTEEYPLATTEYLSFPLPPGVIALIGVGSVYVGKGPIGSANTFFTLLDLDRETGYINLSGLFPVISNVYRDSLLTQVLNPSTDSDSDGFYNGNLWVTVEGVIDTGVRVAYSKKTLLKTLDKGFSVKKGSAGDYVSGEARMHIQNIKGRPYGELIPSDEQNKNLRIDVDNLISYLGSNQNTTIVAGDEDYEYFSTDEKLSPFFVRNSNILPIYTFENNGLLPFTYSETSGNVTYATGVNLQSTNLFQRSEEFDDSYWSKTRASITANTAIAPDGTLTADKLVEDTTSNNTHLIARAFSSVSGTTYTISIFAKASERKALYINVPDPQFGVNSHATFDIENGTVLTTVTGPGNPVRSIVAYPGGWYRCIFTITAVATASTLVTFNLKDIVADSAVPSYTGDGISGAFIWGAQLETLGYASPYISTQGSTVTRTVAVGNLFQDGNFNRFRIASVTLPNIINIVRIDTGLRPLSAEVVNSVASPIDGSISANNNPRDLLLSELKGNAHEIIKFKELYRLQEFSKPEGRIAYGISEAGKRINPRVVLYGSWERKADNLTGEIVISNSSSIGDIQYTGFVSAIFLICKSTAGAPNLQVTVNGETSVSVVSVSQSGAAHPIEASTKGERFHKILIRSGLNPNVISTINMKIAGASTEPLIIVGLEVLTIPSGSANSAIEVAMESGVAFANTNISTKPLRNTATVYTSSNKTGSNYTLYLDRDGSDEPIISIVDTPASSPDFEPNYMNVTYASAGVYNYSTAADSVKSAFFKVGDVVEAIGTTRSDLAQITALSPSMILSPAPAAENKSIRLVCSLGDNTPSDLSEAYGERYEIVTTFLNYTDTDFNTRNSGFKSQRYVVAPDGLTVLAARNTTISIDNRSVIVPASTGRIDIMTLGTRLDLEFKNASPVTITVSIDGSSFFSLSLPAGVSRRTIFNRARYTSHNIAITGASAEFEVTHMTVFTLNRPKIYNKPVLCTMDNVSPYTQEYAKQTPTYSRSLGRYFMDAMHYGIAVKGSGTNTSWTWSDTTHFLGRIMNTQNEGDALRFTFVGKGFEILYLQRASGGGRAQVLVDGVAWNTVGATILAPFTVEAYLDTHGASTEMKTVSVTGLSYGVHTVEIRQDRPGKNPASSGFEVGIFGITNLSVNGELRMSYDKANGYYTPIVDIREYASFYAGLIGDAAFPIEFAEETQAAYALLDGTGTPVNCYVSSATGKTRITLSFNYVYNSFPGSPFGELQVVVDGKEIPRYVLGSTAQAYFKEITGNVIELDSDYSTSGFDIFVKKINGPTQVPIPFVGPSWYGALGDFVYSPALSLTQFRAFRDNTWVAVDGSSIIGSDLNLATGFSTLPVMSGWFVKINN